MLQLLVMRLAAGCFSSHSHRVINHRGDGIGSRVDLFSVGDDVLTLIDHLEESVVAVLRELSARASLSGRPAVHVSCDGFEGPGGVARALLRRLELEVQARHPAPPAGTDVGEPAPGTPATASAPSEHDLEAMLQAMADCVSVLGDRAPVFLLDDGDRLDPLARALIRRWVLEPGLPAAAWVIASRPCPGELDDEARLLSDAGVADTVELGFLGEDDVARLASARLGDPAPDRLVSFLWERASGHPGLTVQAMMKPQYRDFFNVPVFRRILDAQQMGTARTHPAEPLLMGAGNSDGKGDGVMNAADVESQVLFEGTPEQLRGCDEERVRQFVEGEARDRLQELQVTQP